MSPSKASSSATNIPLIIRFYDPETPADQAKDAHDRTLEQILSWSDVQLERCHNYIQMLFPLPEGSLFNWEAPVITPEVLIAFRSRKELRDSLRRSFERMLNFYGFVAYAKAEEDEKPEGGQDAEVEGDAGTEATSDNTASAIDESKDERESSTWQNPADAPSASNQQTQHDSSIDYSVIRGPNWPEASRNWAVYFDHNHLRITRILRCLRVLGLETESDAFFVALRGVFEDPNININQRSMMYWHRAVARPLYIAPDDDRCAWLKKWEDEQEHVEGKRNLAAGEDEDSDW